MQDLFAPEQFLEDRGLRFEQPVIHLAALRHKADLAPLKGTETAAGDGLASVQILQHWRDRVRRTAHHEEWLQNMHLLGSVGQLDVAVYTKRRLVPDLGGRGPQGLLVGLECLKVMSRKLDGRTFPSLKTELSPPIVRKIPGRPAWALLG